MKHTPKWLINLCRMIGYTVRDAVTKHPTESTLIELALTTRNFIPNAQLRPKLATAKSHTRSCRHCAMLLSEIKKTLQHIQGTSRREHSTTASNHYHFKQRSQILRRINCYLAPPATLLRFPAISRPPLARLTPATVFLVLICAAGPFLSIAMRQSALISDSAVITTSPTTLERRPTHARPPLTSTASQPLYNLTTDEQLMAEIEYAVNVPLILPIMALDELTPRLRERFTTVP